MTADAGSGTVAGTSEGITRRQALKMFGVVGMTLAGAGSLLSGCRVHKTNVLLIVADDMRYDHLPYMPKVRSWIADQGRSFTQARCNVPLCQPMRVGLYTGQTSRHHGELGIGYSGTTMARDNILPKWVSDAGNRCGHFGKFTNFYDGLVNGIAPPPGYWGAWHQMLGQSSAEGFRVRLTEGPVTITGRYPTDYLAEEASAFINQGTGQNFMCVVTPNEPHAPFVPRADHADRWLDVVWPIVDEVDVSDKPGWIQGLPPLTEDDKAAIRVNAIGALQELAAVDDMVDQILSSMQPDVLARTVVIFTSDNGTHHGEHRRLGAATKAGPYEVGLHVPLLVRGPGFEPGPDIDVPCLVGPDITTTILQYTDAEAGLPHQGGTSLAALCADPEAFSDRALLHEIAQGFFNQTGDGITTGPNHPLGFRKLYRYPSVRTNPEGPFVYEAYDLDTDPDELDSWADDPGRAAERDTLESMLLALLAE